MNRPRQLFETQPTYVAQRWQMPTRQRQRAQCLRDSVGTCACHYGTVMPAALKKSRRSVLSVPGRDNSLGASDGRDGAGMRSLKALPWCCSALKTPPLRALFRLLIQE